VGYNQSNIYRTHHQNIWGEIGQLRSLVEVTQGWSSTEDGAGTFEQPTPMATGEQQRFWSVSDYLNRQQNSWKN
jgi:hypothetical protein